MTMRERLSRRSRDIARASMWLALGSATLVGVPPEARAGLPKFKMEQSDDRFSTDGTTTWSGHWNRISKRSIGGGRHIDSSGVFLEPMAILDKDSGRIISLGFIFQNSYTRLTSVSPSLSIGQPQRITFLTGEGDPIALEITNPRTSYDETPSCSPAANACLVDEIESGTITLTKHDYERIINATALAAKVEGTRRDWIYETKDIDPTFIANLKLFYDEHLSGS